MLNTITQDILTIIFSYVDYDVLKIPLLSQYFRKYFDNNKNHICHKLFQNKSKYIKFNGYMVYKSLIHYGVRLKYKWYSSLHMDYNIIQMYLYNSISSLLTNDVEDDIGISISIIDNILKEADNDSLILFDLMEFLLTEYNISKKIKILDILVTYHIDIHDFESYYNDYLDPFNGMSTEILWHMVINNYVDLEKSYKMRDMLIDRWFPNDKRIFVLRDKYNINILDNVCGLEEYILSLIDDNLMEELDYIVINFGLDLSEPVYSDALV